MKYTFFRFRNNWSSSEGKWEYVRFELKSLEDNGPPEWHVADQENENNWSEHYMCDSTTMSHIQDVVTEFVEDQRMFTAYDVTIKVREIVGPTVNVKHNEIKNDIHKEMADHLDNDWNKSLEDVGNGKAFVYYHFMSDSSEYEPLPSNPAKKIQKGGGWKTATPATVVVSSSDSLSLDNRSRLLIPTSYMQHLNLKGGDEVNVYKETGKILITEHDMNQNNLPNLPELAQIKVDNHGYLYLSAKILGNGDLGDVQRFNVSQLSNGVEVCSA